MTGEIERVEETGRDGATICGKCGQVISRARVARVAKCGRSPFGATVSVVATGQTPNGDLRASLVGLQRCTSGWECPDCARALQARDATDLHACVLGFRDEHQGGSVLMLTLTVPHKRGDRLEPMRRAVTRAYQKAHSGKAIYSFRKRFGVRSTLRRLEYTEGPNGPHPHLHALVFLDRKLRRSEIESLREWYFVRVGDRLEREGYKRPAKNCINVVECKGNGDYLAKMGLFELAGEQTKDARCSACGHHVESTWRGGRRRCADCGREVNRTAWQILRDYHLHGEERDRRLWLTYCREIRGARRLTWARATKRKHGAAPKAGEQIDLRARYVPEQEALEGMPRKSYTFPIGAWRDLHSKKADILDAFETHDRYALEAALGKWARPVVLALWSPDDPNPDEGPRHGRMSFDDRHELRLAGVT